MTDDEIDPALVQLTRQYPRVCFHQKGDPGHVIQWTSTCTDSWSVYPETEWTKQLLYPAIAATYEHVQNRFAGYNYRQRLEYVGDLYGRGERTVQIAIAEVFPKSK
jgi:hypothetical protein